MITLMNQYVSQIKLKSDDLTKNLLIAALQTNHNIEHFNVIVRNYKFVVDIKLIDYSIENVTNAVNEFMVQTRYPYSAYYLRFNEGNQIRYRYASCKESKDGFYCDIVIS